jgi:hypothetical protein
MLGVHYFSVYRLISARKVEALPCLARQALGALLRIAQTVERRLTTNLQAGFSKTITSRNPVMPVRQDLAGQFI